MTHTPPTPSVPGRLVFQALYGSHAHGTATPTSDEDWRGVFLLPNSAFLGLDRAPQTYEEKPDKVYWELGHFCRLLLKGNPNLVGMLWAPQDCLDVSPGVRGGWPVMSPLFTQRDKFIHSGTADAYVGWITREVHDIHAASQTRTDLHKRLSHIPRLVWEIETAVLKGRIDVRPEGERLEQIMAIKTGVMPFDEAMSYVGHLLTYIKGILAEADPLPEPPREWVLDYLLETRELYGRG